MKLHIGCGSIYLEGYVNIDVRADFTYPNVPCNLLEKNKTTFDKYYKHEWGKGSGKTIVDIESDIINLPFQENSIDEVVLCHILEHIPAYDMPKVLEKIYNILKNGGLFYVAVPDIKGFAKMLVDSKTKEDEEWVIRLIHGTQRDKFCHHYCGFTYDILIQLLSNYGFGKFEKATNINFYPAIHLKSYKNY